MLKNVKNSKSPVQGKMKKKGEKLKIIATDPMIKVDLPTFCRESNCKLIYIKDTEESIFCEFHVL